MPGHLSLSDEVLITQVIDPQDDAGGIRSAVVDMSGWGGVMFVISLGAFTDDATFTAQVVRDDNSGLNSAVNVSGAALTTILNTSPNNVAIIDVFRPVERYVALDATPANNSVVYGAYAIRYHRAGILPPTQAALQTVKVVEQT